MNRQIETEIETESTWEAVWLGELARRL